MCLGDKLRVQRAEVEMTQQQVAEALNIDKTTYAHYESGRRKPNIEMLYKISQLFQISLDQLLDPQLPIIHTIHFPTELLDMLEKVINENCEVSRNWQENRERIEKLRCALQPVLNIRDKALKLPDIDSSYIQPGAIIKRVLLDERGEELIFKCIECQNKLIKKLYGENTQI